MTGRTGIVVAIAMAALLGACETKEHANAEIEAVKKAKEVARQTAAQGDISAADEELGVPECDDYIRKVNTCLDDKVPLDDQPAVRFQLQSQRRKWQKMALDPDQRDALAAECRDAAALGEQSMAKYECAW